MTNGEKLEQIFPDGICPFSQNWLKTEYKEPTTKNDLGVEPTAYWKEYTHGAYRGNDEYGEPIWRDVIVRHCSNCNRRTVIKENYCPNCGAKMVEPQESEDKE